MSTGLARLNRPIVAIIAVGLIAGFIRFVSLDFPQRRIFDEYYYPKSACIFLGYSNERCDINSGPERIWRETENDTGAWVHPPLGKWAIALGELGFGTDSFGWRVSSAVAGTATVVLLAVIVQLLFASAIWTFAGGLLLAVENLHVVQSRTAMLDVFVTLWIVLGFVFVLLDRRWIERRSVQDHSASPEGSGGSEPADADPFATESGALQAPPRVPAPLWRPWRFAAGAALGAGIATKWSALAAILTAIVITFVWEVVRRRRRAMAKPVAHAFAAEGFGTVLAFVVTPLLVYAVSYAGWFAHFGFDLGRWFDLQSNILSYHWSLDAVDPSGEPVHPYLSPAWQWLLLRRPVLYYADYSMEGMRAVIYANGNPAIFWGSLVAIPYTAYAWWRDRDWRAGFVVMAIAGLYLPWFLVSRPQFVFYATPLSPFLVLACLYTIRALSHAHVAGSRSRPYLPVAVGFVAAAVILFAWFWPTLTGAPLTDAAWKLRYWLPTWF
jgi:dolichyl-phosphate-mannose--protein O-mannosyl transferase